jgi:hypothetical protein
MSIYPAVQLLEELAARRKALTAEYRHALAHVDDLVGTVKEDFELPWATVGILIGTTGPGASWRVANARAELYGSAQPEAVSSG